MAYNYANPYTMYPSGGYQPYGQQQSMQYGQPNQSGYQQQSQPQAGLIWVDGEVGAKAYQLPLGWPANTPLPLWDTNDTIIYHKSTNPMGMPNPLQKIHYKLDEAPVSQMPMQNAQSGQAALPAASTHDTGDYVTKEDLEQMKAELRSAISEIASTSQPATKKGGRNESAV